MGVIDLDARVKKLEAEGTGGAVIDQLEAAVTALEAATTPEMAALTLEEGFTAISDDGGCFYIKCGSNIYLHFSLEGLTANTPAIVCYLPEVIRPLSYHIHTMGTGRLTAGAANFTINGSTGKVTVQSPGTQATCSIAYIIPEPEEETES